MTAFEFYVLLVVPVFGLSFTTVGAIGCAVVAHTIRTEGADELGRMLLGWLLVALLLTFVGAPFPSSRVVLLLVGWMLAGDMMVADFG